MSHFHSINHFSSKFLSSATLTRLSNSTLFPVSGHCYHQISTLHAPTHLNHLLNATANTKNLNHATQLHTQLITNNFTCLPFLFNNLLNVYAKSGNVDQSLLLFSTSHLQFKNVVTWTSLVTQLSRSNNPFQALAFFKQMNSTGVYPNHFTFSAVLPACGNTTIIFHGEQIHCLICKHGFDSDVFVGSALVDMYAKCGEMRSAQKVFDEMPVKNLVSWNSMIVGFLQNMMYDKAVVAFRKILGAELISPDQVSVSSLLSACANMGELELGRQVHGVVEKHGLISLAYVKNSLMDMYIKSGLFSDAVILFEMITHRDVVSWNVMVMGCVHNENFEEACNYFWTMRREAVPLDEASYSTVLHASTSLALLNQGSSIHAQIIKTGFFENTRVSSSLITMYAKCGSLMDADQIFSGIKNPNVVCWTAIIAACQQHGYAEKAIELFEQMLREDIKPDYITFVCVISACGHTGRVQEGRAYFNSMAEIHGMNPGHEHYACMVDLLGRAGQLEEAKDMIESMSIEADSSVWGALLGACASHGNLELGKQVAEKLFELEPQNPGNYVLLCNMYSRNGRLKEADEVRRLMGANGVRKEAGCSWIDVKNRSYIFRVDDRSHPRSDEIYGVLRKIEELVKKNGYIAETQYAVNSSEDYKERSLWHHSEKLALAFGILVLPPGTPIRIMKNLRTCGDCHTVMKFASKIFEREIIVRDINRFHRFTDGLCSCRDFW